MDRALRSQIRHLCGYISDKTAVLHYINREQALRLTLRDIEDAVAMLPRIQPPALAPMTPSLPIVTHSWQGYDPLAIALFRYHASCTTGADRAYWLARMTEDKAKPNINIQL